jgi:hypothetical protein
VRCTASVPDITRAGRTLLVTADFGKNPETTICPVREGIVGRPLLGIMTLATEATGLQQ